MTVPSPVICCFREYEYYEFNYSIYFINLPFLFPREIMMQKVNN